jgi:hypothetical protein
VHCALDKALDDLQVARAAYHGWHGTLEGCRIVAIAVPFLTTEVARCWTMFGDGLSGRLAAPAHG